MTTTITTTSNIFNMGYDDWWCPCGVSPSDCKAAYQPKGASSYAASKVNIANPGTYDLSDGVAYPTWATETGWTFASANSQYLTIASAIITAVPLSMVCRFNVDDTSSVYDLMSICDTGGVNNVFLLELRSTIKNIGAYSIEGGIVSYATTTTLYTALTWTTAGFVSSAVNSRSAYINGTDKGTNIDTATPASLDRTLIGAIYYNSSYTNYFKGKISACAFYNIALTDKQILDLHAAMAEL